MAFKKFVLSLLSIVVIVNSLSGCVNRREKEMKLTLEEAYGYTLPLMLMDSMQANLNEIIVADGEQTPLNRFIHNKNIKPIDEEETANDNTDIVFSQIFMNLLQDAVILEIPSTKLLCTITVYDAYSKIITVLDTSRFENDIEKFIFMNKKFDGVVSEKMNGIVSPTDMVWVAVRAVCNSKNDIESIKKIQNKMTSYTLSELQSETRISKVDFEYDSENDFEPMNNIKEMSVREYFSKANSLMVDNQPPAEDTPLMSKFTYIGVGPMLSFDSRIFGDDADQLGKDIIFDICNGKSGNYISENSTWTNFYKKM